MIKFYTTINCPECSEVRDALVKMSMAHEVVYIEDKKSQDFGNNKVFTLPILIDGTEIIQGIKNIQHHLVELEVFKTEWDRFQSDSCYCNEQGEGE